MTNYEHYKKQIEKFTRMGQKVAVEKDTNEIIPCTDIMCSGCLFSPYDGCTKKTMAWADAEYIEPNVNWYKVAIDTPIMVSSNNMDWYCRHFAKYENGLFYVWDDGRTSYTTDVTSKWKYAKLSGGKLTDTEDKLWD